MVHRTKEETPITGIISLTDVNSENPGSLGECNSEFQLNEPSLISNEI